MNIAYDPKIESFLCSKCRGLAEWDDNGDLKCKECGYIYYMFVDDKKVNIFQQELFNLKTQGIL